MAQFDHEKLEVYKLAIAFVEWVDQLLEEIPKSMAAYGQLDRASTSIPINIAEGNGKFTPPDRCRFFDISRGSSLECAACLGVLVARRKVTKERIAYAKEMLVRIVSMLVGLIRANSDARSY